MYKTYKLIVNLFTYNLRWILHLTVIALVLGGLLLIKSSVAEELEREDMHPSIPGYTEFHLDCRKIKDGVVSGDTWPAFWAQLERLTDFAMIFRTDKGIIKIESNDSWRCIPHG